MPTTSLELTVNVSKALAQNVSHTCVTNFLQKFATQQLIGVKDVTKDGKAAMEVTTAEHAKLVAMVNELVSNSEKKLENPETENILKRKRDGDEDSIKGNILEKDSKKDKKDPKATDIMVCINN